MQRARELIACHPRETEALSLGDGGNTVSVSRPTPVGIRDVRVAADQDLPEAGRGAEQRADPVLEAPGEGGCAMNWLSNRMSAKGAVSET